MTTVDYQWNVVQMDAYPLRDELENVVFTVHWTLVGTEGDYTGSVYGSQSVNSDDIVEFTPYEDLTKEQVISWVKDAMGEEVVAAHEDNVARQIEEQKAPKVVNPPLPWA